MRKILIILSLFLVSCEGSLDLNPKVYISADEAFSNRENLDAVVTGCYDALQLQHYYGRNFVLIGDLLADNSMASGTKVEYYSVDDNNLFSDNILVEGIWEDIYTAINRVNYVLYKLSDIDFLSEGEKLDLAGQMKFLRALHYFNLVRLYGAVPLKLEPTLDANEKYYLKRATEEKVFEQIISDLEDAVEGVENATSERANKISAKVLLSMVYLNRGAYQTAYDLAKELLASDLILEDCYPELFSESLEPSEEILFYVPFNPNDKNRLAEYLYPYQLGGRYENSPTPELVSLFEDDDERKDVIAAQHGDIYYSRKYNDLNTGSDRVVVLRAADLHFIASEAAFYLDSIANEAFIRTHINVLRLRAGVDSISVFSEDGIWQAIDTERRIEFAFEGRRWFDLKRNGRALSSLSEISSEDQLLFPIPLSEILANPEIGFKDQNPGY